MLANGAVRDDAPVARVSLEDKMTGLPTDERLLGEIYRRYLRDFSAYEQDESMRSAKIWVPVDIEALAGYFRSDPDLIFGRLYYHMNGKYGSRTGDGEEVQIFSMRIGRDAHCVNFPLLASVLADLRDDHKRFLVSTRIAALSLVISSVSVIIALAW